MNPLREADLINADLMVDRIYEGGRAGNASDHPLPHLVGVSNQGGFRYIGTKDAPKLAVLTSTLKDLDWPDNLDREVGIFTYFGDNKKRPKTEPCYSSAAKWAGRSRVVSLAIPNIAIAA
jgi:hypothetical protein